MVLKANEHFFVFENEKSEAFKFLQLSAKWTTDERAGSRKAHDKSACAVTLFSFSLMSEVLSKNFDQIHIYYLSIIISLPPCTPSFPTYKHAMMSVYLKTKRTLTLHALPAIALLLCLKQNHWLSILSSIPLLLFSLEPIAPKLFLSRSPMTTALTNLIVYS